MFFDCVWCLNGKAWHLFQNIAEVDNRKLETLLLLFLKWNLIFSLLSKCFYFPLSPTRRLLDLSIRVIRWEYYEKQELLTRREHLDFCEIWVAHHFSFLCFLFCISSFCFLCTVLQCLWIVHIRFAPSVYLILKYIFFLEFWLLKYREKILTKNITTT